MPRFHTDRSRHNRPIHWFTVTGAGLFPIDMLRFDMAWPASGEDAAKILGFDFGYPENQPRGERRSIRMGCAQYDGPTIGRWSSFGWTVGDADRDEID